MMRVKMKVLVLLVVGVLCAAPANACLTADMFMHILLERIDEEVADKSMIGYVTVTSDFEPVEPDVSKVPDDMKLTVLLSRSVVTARIDRSDIYPELVGHEVVIRFFGPSTCGPYPYVGQSGCLFSRFILETDGQGHPVEVLAKTWTRGDRRRREWGKAIRDREKLVRDRQAE